MTLGWFDARQAAEVGSALADVVAPKSASNSLMSGRTPEKGAILELLKRADRDVRSLRLNFYKKAKFANSFRWRLIENGVAQDAADELTRLLLMHLSQGQVGGPEAAAPAKESMTRDAPSPYGSGATAPRATGAPDASEVKRLLAQGNKSFSAGDYAESATLYERVMEHDPGHLDAMNNLGAAYSRLGRYTQAEALFRRVVERKPGAPDGHYNLGTLLRWKGDMKDSESSLRRALKLKPNHVDARYGLGLTLLYLGRVRDAKARFEKVLKAAPRHADALFGMGEIASLEGRFDDARALFERSIASNPSTPGAWAAIASTRKMTAEDSGWLKNTEALASSGVSPVDEATLRFAIGKYFDDIKEYGAAFESYQRANELLQTVADHYPRDARSSFVSDVIRSHSREAIANAAAGGNPSERPVFVVGMMRSGTSLTDQIIASHPKAVGAGELSFWGENAHERESELRQGILDATTRKDLGERYLKVLSEHSADALRVVDKSPLNADHLGVIHAAFPKARIIYMRRDPIDTCLSIYFQQFAPSLNFTLDLADLAHYYREHERLMNHWRAVLPQGTMLDVPYADLVKDAESWTRRILDFLGLEFDPRCLDFQTTKRSVVTASAWQVRQKVYTSSVERWRNYEKFLGPLKGLRE